MLKSQVFPESHLAYLYAEWAALEYSSGMQVLKLPYNRLGSSKVNVHKT